MGTEDVSQVSDFHFHAGRKFRLFPSGNAPTTTSESIVRNRLATSSQLGVTFAVTNSNQMVCFPTKTLLSYKVTRENMNSEVTDLAVKSISFAAEISFINDIGINSDGTLLAILHTKDNDVSVDVFSIKTICGSTSTEPLKPICKTRVGLSESNQGSALEWNPAFADTFAAASTDRTVLVVKIDINNPSSQTLVGIGKFGAYTTAISWSPKGKQLTVGDSLGKIVQLKPELEVVRCQFGPEQNPSYGKVTGLCWLATTEWLVSFERGTDHDAYLMRCKKDKPVEWMQYHELSYTSSKWPLPSQLFPSTQLLVDWNVVLIGNSKTSEIVTVGKRDDWQAWVPIDEDGIYLPTTADSRDTVPVGITVDRTATEDVFLTPDGSQKHRPSPLVLCLTNDGVLTTHHVISTFPAHKPCQIQSQNIPITGLSKLQLAPPTVQKALPELSAQKSKVEAAPVTPVPAALFGGAAKPVTTPISAKIPAPVTPNSDKNAEQLNLNLKKKTFIERIQKTRQTIKSSKEEIIKMSLAVQNAKSLVHECAEVVKCSVEDSKGVIEELNNLISSMECIGERTKHTVKELDFEIEEKMELISDVDDGENILEKLRDLSETERMMRFNKLETSADMLKEKFVECAEAVKLLKKALVEKESLRKQSVLSPLRHNSTLNQLSCGAETDVALKVMRNVSKIILDTRERIQRAELEFLHFQRAANNQKEHNQSVSTIARSINNITVRETEENNERNNLSDAEAIKARKALVARIQKRGVVKTKNVTVESYWKTGAPALKNKEDPIDTSNLSNALLKLSMTPRRVMSTSSVLPSTPSVRRDATTQADEPPVVKTVVVTVESPARPVQTPPVSSTPALKTSTSTTTSTSPLAVPLAKPAETSSSIFSGSLTTAPKSSLFANVAPKEEKKKIPEAAKVERIEEKEKETTKKETTVEEPKKVEEKAPEPTVTNEKEEEKKEDTVKSAPSFSFNTTTTSTTTSPKSATSSIFGGGVQNQTTPSSVFGAAVKTTPPSGSIFGGGGGGAFGNFGQSAQAPAAAPAPAPAAATTVSFSFNTAASSAAAAAPPKSSFGAFGAPAAAPAPAKSSVFGASVAPSVPNVDDGMEDDSMVNGGGFMSGLGSSRNTSSGANPFAPKTATATGTSGSSWLFGGAAGGAGQQQQQKPSFSFANPAAQQQQQPAAAAAATSATSTSSVFGSAPKFGSQPVFGGSAAGGGGGLSKNASIFGAAVSSTPPATGGFAQFATGQKTSSLFGGGVSGAAPANTSIFGGGAKTSPAQSSSIFGGGASVNSNKPSSFTSWR